MRHHCSRASIWRAKVGWTVFAFAGQPWLLRRNALTVRLDGRVALPNGRAPHHRATRLCRTPLRGVGGCGHCVRLWHARAWTRIELGQGGTMSRAFVHEDSGDRPSGRRFILPPSDDPGFDAAATKAILEAAREGDTGSAEEATGYYWGEPRLRPHVERILAAARKERDERMVQLAERWLR